MSLLVISDVVFRADSDGAEFVNVQIDETRMICGITLDTLEMVPDIHPGTLIIALDSWSERDTTEADRDRVLEMLFKRYPQLAGNPS